jgi:Ca-activated chloride channel family protein
VALHAKMTGQDETYTTTFDFPDVDAEHPEIERMYGLAMVEDVTMRETVGILPPAESESAIRDLGVKYQLVTDHTSMVVLADDVFEKRGIARNNRQRIDVERAAQSRRASAAPVNRRADANKPMFGGNAPSLKGGGALDPWMLVFALVAAIAAWRARS